MGTDIEVRHHFVSVLAPVVFSWRHRNGHSLKRLKREDLTEKFQTEHITPGTFCKLSVHEMEMLGINSRSDMMSLRIECTKFGEEAPKKLGDLLQEGFTMEEISPILAVSGSTVYRRMRQYGCFSRLWAPFRVVSGTRDNPQSPELPWPG